MHVQRHRTLYKTKAAESSQPGGQPRSARLTRSLCLSPAAGACVPQVGVGLRQVPRWPCAARELLAWLLALAQASCRTRVGPRGRCHHPAMDRCMAADRALPASLSACSPACLLCLPMSAIKKPLLSSGASVNLSSAFTPVPLWHLHQKAQVQLRVLYGASCPQASTPTMNLLDHSTVSPSAVYNTRLAGTPFIQVNRGTTNQHCDGPATTTIMLQARAGTCIQRYTLMVNGLCT